MSKVRRNLMSNLMASAKGSSQLRAETFMEAAGRLVREYERTGNVELLLKAEKILGFVAAEFSSYEKLKR